MMPIARTPIVAAALVVGTPPAWAASGNRCTRRRALRGFVEELRKQSDDLRAL
jgi:hypothetical protein